MKRLTKFIVTVILPLIMSGCGPDFENPLGTSGDWGIDDNPVGVWHCRGFGFEYYLIVNRIEKDYFITTVLPQPMAFSVTEKGHMLKVGDESFMSVGEMDPGTGLNRGTYRIYKYDCSRPGILTLWSPVERQLLKDIRDGKLKGRINEALIKKDDRERNVMVVSQPSDAYVIEESSSNLITYFRNKKNSYDFYYESDHFIRMKDEIQSSEAIRDTPAN